MRARTARQKNIVIVGLLTIVLAMAIGYAAFATQLNINGTANISNTWCVGFKNTNTSTYVATPGKQGATTPTGSISFSGDTCSTNYQTNASLSANFKQPGDKIVYTLTIGNKSSMTAAIKSIRVENQNVTSNTTITKGNIKYTVEMPESTTLAVDAETTMKVTAEFQNDTDINNYTQGETQTISVEINAQQDDGTGGFTPTAAKYTGTIYRWNTNILLNGLTMNGDATVWYPTNDYASASEALADYYVFSSQTYCENDVGEGNCSSGTVALNSGTYTTNASTLNKTYYLKHDVVDDIITASYVCFVYNNNEHCMKGGDNGASFAANTQIIQDYQTFYNLPNNANPGCIFGSSYSYCRGGGFSLVSAGSYGSVNVNGSSSEYCNVSIDGYSNCLQ